MLKQLVVYLRERRYDLVSTIKIADRSGEYDQTYGYPVLAEFETVDFDKLLEAIDEFAGTFNSPVSTWYPTKMKE
jgi:hypothetical protein